MYPEGHSGQGLNYLLVKRATGINPGPRFSHMALLTVDQEIMIHLLKLFLFVLVGIYVTEIWLFNLVRDIPEGGLPLVVDILDDIFAVQRSVPQTNHLRHMGVGVVPLMN